MWSVAAATTGLMFVSLAVWVGRRFDSEQLIAASVASCLLLGLGVVALGWNRRDFPYEPLLGAAILAITAAAFAVDRLVSRPPAPDPRRETVGGFGAFVAGGLVGFYVGFLFSLRGLGW